MNLSLSFLFFLIIFSGIARASEISISSTGSGSDQNVINQALESVYLSGGGIVYLNAGVYEITGTINIRSNTVLTGSKDAVIKVSSSSSQWFTGSTGIISSGGARNNIEIYGFQIDGNCDELPTSYANEGDGKHNAERLILLRGSTNSFSQNIKIHDMKIYDSYSDGIHIGFAENVEVYNIDSENNQHEGIYFVDVKKGSVHNCTVKGITSDCLRFDNSQEIQVYNNYLTSYTGNNNHGSFKDGANGIQVGDQSAGSGKPDYTDQIEIYNNIISTMGLAGIQLDTSGMSQTERVYIHHNTIVNCGYESNAAWGSGIAIGPWGSGIVIENNTLDNNYQASILVLSSIGSGTATIANNNILNTKGNGQARSGGLSPSDVGYGILNLASGQMSLNIFGNFFSGNNLKGDSSVSIISTVSTMIQSAGGDGVSIIGNLPSVPTVDQTGATVPDTITSIFDILKEQFTNSGYVEQSLIAANDTWERKGEYTEAWLDVPVYNNTIRIGNEAYIQNSPENSAYVMYGTYNNAEYPDGQEVSKSLTVESNNKLTVDLTVKTNYKVPETKHIKILGFTLNQTVYRHKSETVTFSKTFDTPKQYPSLGVSDFNVSVTYYNNSYAPHTLVYIDSPYRNLISQVHYSYNDSYADDYCLIGQVHQQENGAKITVFDNLDYWKFSDNKMSYSYGGLYIKNKFDVSKFNVTVKTPYSKIEMKSFNYTEQGDPTNQINRNTVRTWLCVAFLIPFIYAIKKELSFILRRLA